MAKTIKVGKLSYNLKDLIGDGCFSMVYMGFYKATLYGCKKTVAIKQILREHLARDNDFIMQRQEELQQKVGHHPYILGFIYTKIDQDFL